MSNMETRNVNPKQHPKTKKGRKEEYICIPLTEVQETWNWSSESAGRQILYCPLHSDHGKENIKRLEQAMNETSKFKN
jgi:hypothetical protein